LAAWDPNIDQRDVEKFYVKYAVDELREAIRFLEKHTGAKWIGTGLLNGSI